jgi:hypothetical protein
VEVAMNMGLNIYLRLQRVAKHEKGAFGVLVSYLGLPFAVTVERTLTGVEPVIPAGSYTCKKTRYIKGGYDTFEITGVAGHDRLLFHQGNRETDSIGCVIVAEKFEYLNGEPAVLESSHGFAEFWQLYGDRESFQLEIRDS